MFVERKETPVLETERLVLWPLSEEDLAATHRIFNDPAVRRYPFDSKAVSVETTRSVLEASTRDFAERGIGLFGVRLRGADGELVGLCGLRREAGLGEMEVIYCLLPERWGRGLATEAAEACLRMAFEEVGLERVMGGADEPNVASLQVIERLGMRFVGRILPGAPEIPYFVIEREDFFGGRDTKERGGRRVGQRSASGRTTFRAEHGYRDRQRERKPNTWQT